MKKQDVKENSIKKNNDNISAMSDDFYTKMNDIDLCRNRFIENGDAVFSKHLSPLIFESWKASANYGVDPHKIEFSLVSDKELRFKIETHTILSDICEICLYGFFSGFKNDKYQISLFDSEAILLRQFGNAEYINKAKGMGIAPGLRCSEDTIGTSAVTLALKNRRAVLVAGPEHYSDALQDAVTYAVPLRQGVGEIIGAFSLMCECKFQEHGKILNFVSAIGKVIEYAYDWKKRKEQKSKTLVINNKINSQYRKLYTFEDIIGNSHSIKEAVNLAKQAAKMPFNVLLKGETGTGKELFAQAIHFERCRETAPFVSINCAAVPPELFESELFGYTDGAFTGAARGGKAGLLETAAGGTIFLDEINSMPLIMQAKLLHVLQNKIFNKIGSVKNISINANFISASNTDLYDEVRKGRFREDLFYRLNVVDINLPPLRNRKSDIPIFVYNSLNILNESFELFLEIKDDALEFLLSYHWPGNVRELEHKVEKASVYAVSKGRSIITADDFGDLAVMKSNTGNDVTRRNKNRETLISLSEIEKQAVIDALERCKYNKTKAARELGITRKTLYKKLELLEL